MEITDQHDPQITFQFRFWFQISQGSGWVWDDTKITKIETKILSDSEFWPLQNWMKYHRNRISHSEKVSVALDICLLCSTTIVIILVLQTWGFWAAWGVSSCYPKLFILYCSNQQHITLLCKSAATFCPILSFQKMITIWKKKKKVHDQRLHRWFCNSR